MDKRALAAIPRETASTDMLEIAGRLGGMRHIVTARLIEENKILLLNFFEIETLRKGKTDAEFRTFLSKDDYITQDLKTQKVRWKTASFYMMDNFSLWDSHWNEEKKGFDHKELVFIRTNEEMKTISDFFAEYATETGKMAPWDRVYNFQESVKARRLAEKHKKETEAIDAAMEPIKEVPEEFYDWVWENGMCPFCGSKVTIKARGRLPAQIFDERWFLYVDPTQDGFILRYFKANRRIRSDSYADVVAGKNRVEQDVHEYSRAIYTFPGGKPKYVSYEWGVYKQRGMPRWCPDSRKIACMECILYPGNLPHAWEHTPMKYSALEILSGNIPTVSLRYEDGIRKYLDFPKLEWFCKMGLNQLAKGIINGRYHGATGRLDLKGETIYKILGLNKVNTKILQEIDGNFDELRLLQVAQGMGLQLKPTQLKEYYETFECNVDLLKQANRKVSLHKLVKYIGKESERYPIGEHGGCSRYSYMRYREPEDPRIERKQNMARDWLEYLGWCKELKYDLDNMFIYMPKNFKKVHDRTAKEYQALQDKKAAAEKRRREREAKKRMEQTKAALAEILEANGSNTDAFALRGKGLILIVPKSADDIKAEGAALHHCVGTYVERVAKGETAIFFIRKKASPEKPYYTMEWKDNKVFQCRGLHNCDMTPEVKAFTEAFEKIMLSTIKQDKQAKRKAVSA